MKIDFLKKNDRWIDVLLVAASLVVFFMILHRLNPRREPAAPMASTRGAGSEPWTDGEGIARLDFNILERVEPDENYHPVYSPGIRALEGETVRIQGFMTPFQSLTDMSTFMLFPFPTGCNFCAPPAVNQVVLIRQREGKRRYPFIDAPIVVTGTLRLWSSDSEDPAHTDDMFLYILEDTEVKALDMDPIERERFHRGHQAQGRLPGI